MNAEKIENHNELYSCKSRKNINEKSKSSLNYITNKLISRSTDNNSSLVHLKYIEIVAKEQFFLH